MHRLLSSLLLLFSPIDSANEPWKQCQISNENDMQNGCLCFRFIRSLEHTSGTRIVQYNLWIELNKFNINVHSDLSLYHFILEKTSRTIRLTHFSSPHSFQQCWMQYVFWITRRMCVLARFTFKPFPFSYIFLSHLFGWLKVPFHWNINWFLICIHQNFIRRWLFAKWMRRIRTIFRLFYFQNQ